MRAGFSVPRFLDVIFAATAFVCLAPLLLLIALALWIESGRPVFFKQLRIGQGGRHFWIYKFRKFHPTIVQRDGPLTVKGDPRLTRLGKFLDTTKLNELPQFWNVLKGDMSLVGPRPEMLEFLDCYSPDYLAILEHRPGLFGPSQVAFREEGSLYPGNVDQDQFYRNVIFPMKARMDLAYFPARSTLLDLGWILVGVLAVLGCWLRLPQRGAKYVSLHMPVRSN
jgi:lipopolysaccharide/colanic/teichoic acid biosynthesis glycosyltransferase